MNRIFLPLMVFLISLASIHAQTGISINPQAADSSAMLDVMSTSQGVLFPRMTFFERDNIYNPATGLLVFCTDSNLFYFNTGIPSSPEWVPLQSQWVSNGQHVSYGDGNVGIGEPFPSHRLTVTTPLEGGEALRLIGPTSSWGYGARLDFGIEGNVMLKEDEDDKLQISATSSPYSVQGTRLMGGNVGIGTTTPHSSAGLDVSSTDKGFLPPRMTKDQINAIPSPPDGMVVYNTDTHALMYALTGYFNYAEDMVGKSCGEITIGGQTYQTVLINCPHYGDDFLYHDVLQCWMKENLNIGTMIPASQDQTNNGIIEKYCYNNDPVNCSIYGGLYQFSEANDYEEYGSGQGICPEGWKLPLSNGEWHDLLGNFMGAGKLKEAGTAHWTNADSGASNLSGFTALPGGVSASGGFGGLGDMAFFWSVDGGGCIGDTTLDAEYAMIILESTDETNTVCQAHYKAMAVRCVRPWWY